MFPPPFRLLDTEAAGTNNGNESMQYSIPENIYGHRKRLEWILRHVHPGQRVVELGCGTGHMITRPLLKLGYDAYGVDLDERSIQFGRERFRREGLDPHRLLANNIDTLSASATRSRGLTLEEQSLIGFGAAPRGSGCWKAPARIVATSSGVAPA